MQRPSGNGTASSNGSSVTSSNGTSYSSASNGNGYSNGSSSLDSDTMTKVRNLLAQGYKIGTEHADKRHFRAKSWKSCAPIDSHSEGQVVTALEGCLQEHSGEYVRLIGIDTEARRRVLEAIIQRP